MAHSMSMKSTARLSSTKSMPNFAARSDGKRDSVTRAINRRSLAMAEFCRASPAAWGGTNPAAFTLVVSSLYVNASGPRQEKEQNAASAGNRRYQISSDTLDVVRYQIVCGYASLVSRKLNLIKKKEILPLVRCEQLRFFFFNNVRVYIQCS